MCALQPDYWPTDGWRWSTPERQGINIGGWGIHMAPRDMAKLGYLFLKEGVWDGRQLVPAGWIADAVAQRVDTSYHG
jgi:CubicO group peptidase (beta-lactamase class C family)